jgi:hypothetical protein
MTATAASLLDARARRTIGKPISANGASIHDTPENGANGTNGVLALKKLALIRASDVTMQPVEWLWDGRIPRGKLSGLEGRMGTGKTTVLAAVMAAVTRGIPLPGHNGEALHGPAILISLEDDKSDTLVPRLKAAGADLSICRLFDGYEFEGEMEGGVFNLSQDVERLRRAIEETGAVFVAIDPFMATIDSSVNSHKDQDVRRVLAPLGQVAEATGAAITFVRHFRKGGGVAEDAGGGSGGIGNAFRSVMRVDRDPEDDQRLLLSSVKSSVSAKPATLGYRIEEARFDDALDIVTSKIRWDGESTWTAEALANHSMDAEDRPRATEAEGFLRDALSGGPRLAKEIFRAGDSEGIPKRTLQRAADTLKVAKDRKGFGEGSVWSLPSHSCHSRRENTSTPMGTDGGANGGSELL